MSGRPGEGGRCGTRYWYIHGPCRCSECRAANTQWQLAQRQERCERLAANPTLVPHGRVSTYSNWGCRCEPCAGAWKRHCASDYERRKARLAADPTIVEHGRKATYTGWGCRCDECCDAAAEYQARRRSPVPAAPPEGGTAQ